MYRYNTYCALLYNSYRYFINVQTDDNLGYIINILFELILIYNNSLSMYLTGMCSTFSPDLNMLRCSNQYLLAAIKRCGEIEGLGLTYTQRYFFEVLLNQPEIRLYLPFSD